MNDHDEWRDVYGHDDVDTDAHGKTLSQDGSWIMMIH